MIALKLQPANRELEPALSELRSQFLSRGIDSWILFLKYSQCSFLFSRDLQKETSRVDTNLVFYSGTNTASMPEIIYKQVLNHLIFTC